MSSVIWNEGDDLRVPARMVVAPESGTFEPVEFGVGVVAGGRVRPGTSLGNVSSLGRSVPVLSPFAGFLMGILALPGERVRAGEPIAWLSTGEAS